MMSKTPRISKHHLISRMIENALWESVLFPHRTKKPGEHVLRLSEEQREVLKNVNSDDFQHRLPEFAPFYEESHYKTFDKPAQ